MIKERTTSCSRTQTGRSNRCAAFCKNLERHRAAQKDYGAEEKRLDALASEASAQKSPSPSPGRRRTEPNVGRVMPRTGSEPTLAFILNLMTKRPIPWIWNIKLAATVLSCTTTAFR